MADYIIEPLDTDPETIFQEFNDFVVAYFPDWQPSEGQLDVIIARYFAMQTAFTADMASRVLRAIYRYFGSSLAGIPPLPGSAAQVTLSFVIDDPVEPPIARTLPFGTLIGLTDFNGDTQMFSTLDDMAIAAGDTTAEVVAQALELGVAGNDLNGSVEMIELVDWITSGSVVGVSSGGSNPEEDEVYMQRLTENLALMAPRPILAQDFAIFAQNVPGVWRAAVIDNYRDTGGGTWATDRENAIAISAVDESGNELPDAVRDQLIAYLESTRSQNFIIEWVDPVYHEVDVNYTARILRGQDPASVKTQADIALTQYLDPANWGIYPPESGNRRLWLLQPNVRYLELTTVLENVPGIDYTESLTFSLDGSAFDTTNKAFTGPFSLTTAGTITGIINLPI